MLFTFPSRYSSTIGRQVVFSLGRWSSQIPTGFLVSRGTRVLLRCRLTFRIRGYHSLWPAFPGSSARSTFFRSHTAMYEKQPHNPRAATRAGLHNTGLGSSPFARHYLGNHSCFLFLQVLRCFSSLGSLRTPMYSAHDDQLAPAGLPHSEISGSKPV